VIPAGKTVVQRILTLAHAVAMAGLLGACATTANPKDPIEGFNRAVFAFNDSVDTAIIRPVAVGYDTALPTPVKSGVSNFFGNIADVFIAVNNLLQGKLPDAASDAGRFAINSTVGVLGIFDWATDLGLEKHDEDFGQTFGRWGVGDGAYLVLPFFGPSTLRDGVGLVFDVKADPVPHYKHVAARNTLLTVRGVNERATLLPADKLIAEAALDKYSYIRDGYLQRRRNKIYDGNAPRVVDED